MEHSPALFRHTELSAGIRVDLEVGRSRSRPDNVLLIADGVQTGLGRTGKILACTPLRELSVGGFFKCRADLRDAPRESACSKRPFCDIE